MRWQETIGDRQREREREHRTLIDCNFQRRRHTRTPMEVSGNLLRQLTYVSGAGTHSRSSFSRRSVAGAGGGVVPRGCVRVSERPRTVSVSGVMGSGFRDDGHVQYYRASPTIRCGGKDKMQKGSGSGVLTTKKKLKLLKGLSEGLSMFSELGFSLDPEKRTLLDEVQGTLTSDAAEVLLKQVEQLRAEEKEMKRKRKQEKAKLKATTCRKKTVPDCESSSSSSESSDSECGEVVDMTSLRAGVTVAPAAPVDDELQPPAQEAAMLSLPPLLSQTATVESPCPSEDVSAIHHAMELCSRKDDTCLSSTNSVLGFKNNCESTVVTTTASAPQKMIEVCMGNKCKRSGAAALLQEFERVMGGVEGGAAVVGCKCMGKCKSGPNVRIQNSVVADSLVVEGLNDSVKIPANPLCIGVGLEDVDTIVASYFGENKTDMGMVTTAAT